MRFRFFSRVTLLQLLVVAVTLLVFSRLVACDFTWWDDNATVSRNSQLKAPGFYWTSIGTHAPMQLYIPVTYTFWSAVARIATLKHPDADGILFNPHIFHFANVILHAITALLIFKLILQLIPNPLAAAAAALLFALHPVQVEPVAWISGTKDVLCGLLSVASLFQYVRYVKSKNVRWRYFAALLLLILAMLAKPTAIVVPLMAASIDRFILQRTWRKVLTTLSPWFFLMVPCAIVTMLSQPAIPLHPTPTWISPAIAGDALAFYLCKLSLPLNLAVDYGRRPVTVIANGWIYYTWLLPLAVSIILFVNRRRWAIGLTAGLLFLLPLLPVLGFTPFMFQEVSTTADHYLYLAMLGPALLVGWFTNKYANRLTFTIVTITLLLLAIRTITSEPVWQNTQTLFQHALAVNPKSFVACDMLGYDHARAARLLRNQAFKTNNDQLTENARAQFEKAAGYYIHGLEINPQYVPSLFNLAIVFQELGQPENARLAMRRIADLQLSLPPGLRTDPLIIAEKLISFGDYSQGIRWLDDILLTDPENARALKLRAAALASTRPASP